MATQRKKILTHNPVKFLQDLDRVRTVLVLPTLSNVHFTVKKKEVRAEAETRKIEYFLTKEVMVIL